MGVLDLLHTLHTLFSQDTSLHKARFATRYDLMHLSQHTPTPNSLLVGRKGKNFLCVSPTHERRELGNMLIVAPTRSGKSLLATSQLLTWQHSVIVNDIKGELFTLTAGYRSTLGDVFVIDPTGVGNCYDPLQNKQSEDAFSSAATHLLFDQEEREHIFTQRAITMLTQLFMAAYLEQAPLLPYVRHFIRSGLDTTAKHLHRVSPSLAQQFLDLSLKEENFSDRFLLSSWSTLTSRLRPILTERVVRCFTKSDFSPADLMCADRPVTIYLRWKEQDLQFHAPFVRLLWGSLMNELITTYDQRRGAGCTPVLMLIDEAGRTAIPSLADQAATVVGRGIYLWIAVQSLSQLELSYGKARAHVLLNNMESQLYYRQADLDTAEYVARRLGEKSAFARSTTLRDGEETSEGRSERAIPLLTPQDIMQLEDEEIIAFHRKLPPCKLKRIDWRTSPLFRERVSLQPPAVFPLPETPQLSFQTEGETPQEYVDPDRLN